MKKLYGYLYYRAYDLLGLTGDFDVDGGASHFLAFVNGLIVIKLLSLLLSDFFNQTSLGITGVTIFLVFYTINYYTFLKNEKYTNIINIYKGESKSKKIIGRSMSIIIFLLVIYSLF